MQIEDLIPEEDNVVTITNTGYIKRLPVSVYRKQRRGGKGVTGMDTKEEDYVVDLFVASTHDFILFFSSKGKVFKRKAFKLPAAGRYARGKPVVNLLERLDPDEKVEAMIRTDVGPFPHGTQAKEFEYMTRFGMAPAQAIQAATVNAAELMGWQDRVGTVETGKFADLIAVPGNPLDDITELERVKFVMKGGEVVRNDLR